MKRILQAVLFLMLPLLLSSWTAAGPGNWVVVEEEGAAASPAPQSFTAQEMQRMGVFLSNFTEVGLYDIDAAALLAGSDPRALLHFGVRHNYVNAFKRTVKPCPVPGCPHGSLVMDAADVGRVYLRYLGSKPAQPVNCEEYAHFDGRRYHFEGADGEAAYYARVRSARRLPGGEVEMRGDIYNPEEPSVVQASFVALARDHTWNNKPAWALISLKSSFKK